MDISVGNGPEWARSTTFYQIFPERFARSNKVQGQGPLQQWGATPNREEFQGGDLPGITSRLSHLADMGIGALWLNPIFAADTNHRYDTKDYYEIDPRLGSKDDFRALVSEAHRLGIHVILDGVFNHCGESFGPFRDVVANGAASRFADWFSIRSWPVETNPPTYQTCGGATYLPKLNLLNPEVRDYFCKVGTYWIEEFDIDGWRLDVPWKAPHDFWVEFRSAVLRARPDAYLVGEIWRDATPWLDVFHGTMNYPMRNVITDYCLHDHMDAEDAALEISQLAAKLGPSQHWMLNLLGSHDTPRIRTVGSENDERLRLAFVAMFTLPGIPMIYYGDELDFVGDNDPGCRGAMPEDLSCWTGETVDFLTTLARLRHALPPLQRGEFDPVLTFNGLLAYRRFSSEGEVIVILNVRSLERDVRLPVASTSLHFVDHLTSARFPVVDGEVHLSDLAPGAALILTPESEVNPS